ncbi:MAG TPA: transglutaminase domain-containing protein [Planctomycetota bacterium]|jgi:hypothetical protein
MTAMQRDNKPSGSEPALLPWQITAATLTAFAAFIVARRQVAMPAALAGAVVLSLIVPLRMKQGTLLNWAVRVLLYSLFLVVLFVEPPVAPDAITVTSYYIDAAIQLTMAELAVQYWQWPRWGGARSPYIALLSGCVLVAASRTFEGRIFPLLVPIYILLLIFAVRASRRRASMSGRVAIPLLTIVVFTLALGFGAAQAVLANRREIAQARLDIIGTLANTPRLGVVNAPSLGSVHDPLQSMTRILRVRGLPASGSALLEQGMHLRGLAYDTYLGGSWLPLPDNRTCSPVPQPELRPEMTGHPISITRLTNDFKMLFTPLNAAAVVAWGRIEWSGQDGGPLQTGLPFAAPYSYDVLLSDEPHHQGPLCTPLDEKRLARCLTTPPSMDRRVRELARQIVDENAGPLERIIAVKRYLRENHRYSMNIDPEPGDPVSVFLLQKMDGHCEYFASAAVVLLRCLKVPTRYVTGFYAHERSSEDSMIVRERDSHAWAESWVDGTGWITVEATPPDGRPDRTAVILPFWRRWWEAASDMAVRLPDGVWVAVLCALLAILGCISYLRIRARQQASRVGGMGFRYTPPLAALAEIARKFEALLSRKGIPCPPHRPWGEHLDTVSASASPQQLDWDEANAFVRAYNAQRFGSVDESELSKLREHLKKLGGDR